MPNNKETVELESTVKFIRLINGDDIISEVRDEQEITMVLANPMKVLVDADLEVGKQTIYMHTWMPQGIAKENFCTLSKKDVIFIAEIEEDIEEYYRGVVFDIMEDRPKLKKQKEYIDDEKKVISFNSSSKSNKDNPSN
jgi:hypothetical protein